MIAEITIREYVHRVITDPDYDLDEYNRDIIVCSNEFKIRTDNERDALVLIGRQLRKSGWEVCDRLLYSVKV